MSTEMYVDPRLARPDTDDDETVTHVVRGLPGQDSAAVVKQAYRNGTVLVALCGHRWIPTKDPAKYPVCQPCLSELQRLRGGT